MSYASNDTVLRQNQTANIVYVWFMGYAHVRADLEIPIVLPYIPTSYFALYVMCLFANKLNMMSCKLCKSVMKVNNLEETLSFHNHPLDG